MNRLNEERLMAFHFGALSEEERLLIERDLLSDPEVLVEYLDLKRDLEAADRVPQQPSPALWRRLRPLSMSRRARMAAALGLGAAIAASYFAFTVMQQTSSVPNVTNGPRLLFDGASEHFAGSNVL